MAQTSQVERISDIGGEPIKQHPLTDDFFLASYDYEKNMSVISKKFLDYLEKKPTNLNNLADIHYFLIHKLRSSMEFTFWVTVFKKFKSYLKNHRLDGSKISSYDFTPSLIHKFFVDTINKTGISLYYHLVAKKMISKYDEYGNKFHTSLLSLGNNLDYDFDHIVHRQTDTPANGGKNYISKSRKRKNKKKRKSKTRRKSRK